MKLVSALRTGWPFRNRGAISAEQLQRRFRRLLRRIGTPGVVAFGLLVMCVAIIFSGVLPLQERRDAAKLSVLLAGGGQRDGRAASATPEEQLEEFYRFFPKESNAPKWLGKMVEIGEQCGLNLNQGEYAVTQDKVGKLSRFKISLPVEGRYLQIRKFLAAMTTEMPMMALENVQFERKDIAAVEVQAKIKLVLYLGRGDGI